MKHISLNSITSRLNIMTMTLAVFFVFVSCIYNSIDITNTYTNKTDHRIISSTISPFPIKISWAASLNASMDSSQSSLSSTINNISLVVKSQNPIHDIAGKFVKVKGVLINNNTKNITKSGIAYISIVDLKNKIPIDLEDWSAEKGLYIPAIKGGQSLPLEWNVRLVKSGSYTIDILFNTDGDLNSPSVASSKILLEVFPKINLNPGNVLSVAFGVPVVVIATLGLIGYTRGKRTGIHK